MAENRRYRHDHQDDQYTSRDASADSRPAQTDPLAELARLIGQNDPFAGFGRAGARTSQEAREEPVPPAPGWLSRGSHSYGSASDANDPYAPQSYDAAGYDDPAGDGAAYYDQGDAARGYGAAPESYAPEPYVPQDGYGQGTEPAYGYAQEDARYAAPAVDPYRMDDDRAYQEAAQDPAEGYYSEYPEYPEDAMEGGEPLRERRRGGMMTVAAVVGLALVGTAGAFGYRALTGGTTSNTEPPVIKADPTPSKVTPAKTADAQPNKLIYDRVGEQPSQGERVVPREEQPVDVKPTQPTRSIAMAPGLSGGTATAAPAAPTFPPSVNEPKKVRSIPIRPEQTGGVPAASENPPPAPSTRQAPQMASAEPDQPVPAPQPRRGDGPAATAPEQPARTAAVAPRAPVTRGGYVVQVSSQRSEADAQASYRALQSRYSRVLNGRDPIIRRVDLGDKGVYYRAQVGPFATADQATALCNDLKSAGGACIVQRN